MVPSLTSSHTAHTHTHTHAQLMSACVCVSDCQLEVGKVRPRIINTRAHAPPRTHTLTHTHTRVNICVWGNESRVVN